MTETEITPPAAPAAPATPTTPATPAAPADGGIKSQGQVPDHLKDVSLKDTFLPEDENELPPGSTIAKTPEQIAEEAAGKPVTPVAPVVPAAPTVQPKTTQNAEILDKTKPEETLLAGKYKTVEELKKGIEELGGDPAGITDPKALEQVYKVSQAAFTRWQQRQKKAEDLATTPDTTPKGFQLTDEMVKGMMDQLDYNKIDNSTDLAQQMFRIIFSEITKNLPQMLPKQAPAMDPVEMAAQVETVKTATDALGFIEAKVPKLISDARFRNQFAIFIDEGKTKGTYPKTATRESITQAMKDFQKMLAEMAGVTPPADTQDKSAATVPDAGGTASTETTPDPDDDILGSILGAKEAHEKKFG